MLTQHSLNKLSIQNVLCFPPLRLVHLYVLIVLSPATPGSSVLCAREGHLQTCVRGAREAVGWGEGYPFPEP